MKVSPHLPIKFVQSLKLIECADESTSYDQTFHVIRLDILNPFDKDFDANTLLDNHRMRGTSTSNYRCAYLHDAVYNGDVILACEMIRLGSKIDVLDSKGRTPLLLGTIRLANLARRATTDRPPSPSKGPYPRILTILRILIEHLADVSYIFNRRTPLHYACDARDWELVALLINHGANPSLRGTEPIIPSLNTTDTHRIQTLLQQHHRTKDNTPLTRPCPCFSGLSLNECHAKREHAYPGHHACPSGLGCQGLKPYISCCSPRRIQALESWDSEAQRIKTTVTKSIHPDPEEEMADHPMHDIRKKLTRYFSGGLPLDGSVVDIMRFFACDNKTCPEGLSERASWTYNTLADHCSRALAENVVDPAFRYALKRATFIPWPVGRQRPKAFCRERQERWNVLVDRYIDKKLDTRPREEIERSAKLSKYLGAYIQSCHSSNCQQSCLRDEEGKALMRCTRCKIARSGPISTNC